MSYRIITVNREFESLGNEIAQAVALKLDIPYYDKFLITAASEQSGVRESKVAEVQFRLIREIAQEGPCVIVGRCANHLLRDRDDVLDIFIHAGEDFRLKRAIEVLGLSPRQAKKVLRSTDRARKAYYKNYTGTDWNDPDLYHAVLNPDRLSFDACVTTICDLYQL